jgi:cytochrome c-type biogenesis protein CcmE
MKKEYKALIAGVMGGVLLLLVALTILGSNQYMTVSELYQRNIKDLEVVVMGKVANNSISYSIGNIEFVIYDENSTLMESVKVVYIGEKNIDVYDGAIVVVKGIFDGEKIMAREVLTKCPSTYEPSSVEE